MKQRKRMLSVLLAAAMATGCLPPAMALEDGQPASLNGSLKVTVRFDLPQSRKTVENRDLTLKLEGGSDTRTISLSNPGENVEVVAKNVDGKDLTTEGVLGYYDVILPDIEVGTDYTLTLSGTGYTPYTTTVRLDMYGKHLIVGTGDGTFSLGDVTGDGTIDKSDLEKIDENLGKKTEDALATCDLNGDGYIDIVDLSYVNFTRDMTDGDAEVFETELLKPPTLDASNLTYEGDIKDLFLDNDMAVTVAAKNDAELMLPLTLTEDNKGVEMDQIVISCPQGEKGAIEKGEAVLELADGTTTMVPFNYTAPADAHAIGRVAGESTIVINLAKRVAVKKVTIRVTAVTGQTGTTPEFATITNISFLKDIVPENPANNSTKPQKLVATADDGAVSLTWNAVRNVTGYRVEYGLSENALTNTLDVNTNKATVSGLDNMKKYFFRVVPVNVDWSGTPSDTVDATPQPKAKPGAPSNIVVTGADASLRVSWGQTKDASFYQLFYRKKGDSDFIQFSNGSSNGSSNLTGTSATIGSLVNGTEYEVAVKAGNNLGVGPFSAVAIGTPRKEELALPDFPTENRIPASEITSVTMTNANNVNRTLCPNFKVGDVIDNDAATYWIANQWWVSPNFTFTFKEPQNMNYMIYVPYLADGYRTNIKSYNIIAEDANEKILLQATYGAPQMTDKNYLVFTFPSLKGVKKLTVGTNEKEGNGKRVSFSEAAFYNSDGLDDDIASLFSDGTFTELNSDVTQGQIDALSARLTAKFDYYLDRDRLRDELNLASDLLSGKDTALGLVKNDFQSRSAAQDKQYGQSASALQPLGVTARAGSTIAIYAQIPDGADVSLVPTQYFGESGVWSGSPVTLRNGRNYITIPKIGSLSDERGGSLYITYAGDKQDEIKLHVRCDKNAFTVPVLELSDWYTMSETERRNAISKYVTDLQTYVNTTKITKAETDIRNVTEISTPSVLLSIPATQALAGLNGIGGADLTDTMYNDVLAWEEVLFIANKTQGIIPSNAALETNENPMRTRQNIRYQRMFAGAFMYAAGNHIGVQYGSTSALVCGRPTSMTGEGNSNALFGWGIAHEIGHNMDKLGKAEITNNIYSLAMQANDGAAMTLDTRLTKSNIWESVYDKVSAGRPGTANNVFTSLAMYWQLHLAYDEAEEPLAFYNKFMTQWKAGKYNTYTYDERVALIASDVADRNLTEFFTRWGMVLGDGAKAEIAKHTAEPRAVWYMNDASRTYRLTDGAAWSGTVTATAAAKDNTVTVTVTGGDSSIAGYEILRNGKAIGYTTTGLYTDDLGAANNLPYSYSVVPVDKLGNTYNAVSAGEVRIAYDKAIDASAYNVTHNGDTMTFTMRNGAQSITGLKVTGASGDYTVRVKGTAPDTEWVTAKTGTWNGTQEVIYFNKPGADSTDTRIWTYDAEIVEVTGIPEGATVQLLDYPGDRIDFLEGATVGTLKADYKYGDSADDVIKAGTLVIAGTYRGDPVYNTIEIEAEYNTTTEAGEAIENGFTTIERPMNGDALLFAEIPTDGKVSDISDGIFLFIPNAQQEEELNAQSDVTDKYPLAIRATFYRNDTPDDVTKRRMTSQTLWVTFPDEEDMPNIELTQDAQK